MKVWIKMIRKNKVEKKGNQAVHLGRQQKESDENEVTLEGNVQLR